MIECSGGEFAKYHGIEPVERGAIESAECNGIDLFQCGGIELAGCHWRGVVDCKKIELGLGVRPPAINRPEAFVFSS